MITFRGLCHPALILACAATPVLSQQLDILVIGSSHSFSEGSESGVVHEKPFNPAGVATQLQNILSQDPLITQAVNVEFEDIYKTKAQTVNYTLNSTLDFTSHCYSLAQHFMWPEGQAARLANLRGEGSRVWDYIVLCNDPYIMANFPGMVAEGVKMIQQEVAKSANPAQIVLMGQWPESTSTFTANFFNEISHRVGNSAGITVVPAGKAWDGYSSKDTHASHPTPRGEYLAAASIYSKLFNRSAKNSGYDFPTVGDEIADHSLAVIQANAGVAQYTGTFTRFNPFQMKYLSKRTVSYRETGTSTEDGLRDALLRLDDVQRITFTTTGYAGVPGTRWDFNFGRGNDWWEDDKDYEVNPNIYDWVYGFPMQHYLLSSALNTMPYGIDKHYNDGTTYEDGTDLGIPYNMIRPGTREPDWPEAVRAIPMRMMWLKMREIWPVYNPLGDNAHMDDNLNDASAAFMYTLLSGRCPVVAQPANPGSNEWLQWLGHKIGYETAWQMSHLTTRAPGLRVLPSAVTATSVTPTTTETMTVQFAYPPQSEVTVAVSVSNAGAAIVGPKTLTFTPTNYNTPQPVTVAGIPGATASPSFNVVFNTTSNDEIYNGLSDSWSYTTTRTATAGLTQTNNGTSSVSTVQNTPVSINLNVPGSNSGNTRIIGLAHGSITWTGDSTIQYTPSPGYLGTDQLAYAATVGTAQKIGYIDITIGIAEGQANAYVGDAAASEVGPDTGTFVITRYGNNNSPLNVFFSMGGTANLGTDYTISHTSPVTIPAGQDSVTIILTPATDSITGEGYETAILTLTADAAYPIGIASATVNIAPPLYAITYDGNGNYSGSGPVDGSSPYADVSTVTVQGDTGSLVRAGYTFGGWNTNRDGSGIGYVAGNTLTLSTNTVLYARWIPIDSASAAITFVGTQLDLENLLANDATVGWRNTTPSKPLDIDGNHIIGSDGWRLRNTSQNPPYATASIVTGVGSNNVANTFIDSPANPSGPDVTVGVLHDTAAGAGVESTPLLQFVITGAVPAGETLRVGILFDTSNSGNTAKYSLKQTVGGSVSATTPVYPWNAQLDVSYFDLTGIEVGDTFVVTSTTISTPVYPSAMEQVIGVTFDTGIRPALAVHIANTEISESGGTTTATISRVGTSGDLLLNLTSSDPGEATVPATVTIPHGSSSVNATVSGVADGMIDGTQPVTIGASAATYYSGYDSVNVTDADGGNTFAGWIGSFNIGGQTGFDQDADGDGLANGVEAFFGTPPDSPSSGISSIERTENTLSFNHPEASPPLTDVTCSYRWSLDLVTWHDSGETADGTTVTFSAMPNTPAVGMTKVTGTIAGNNPPRIFTHCKLQKNN